MRVRCVGAYMADALSPPKMAFVFEVEGAAGMGRFTVYFNGTWYQVGSVYRLEVSGDES